ncbi:MAG: T9SS type A sorting domain-containing protein [Chitinophagaceae bacterium]|nr:T9SS type A sorting domain-containing protein [Chitinophagaceae bacterium]
MKKIFFLAAVMGGSLAAGAQSADRQVLGSGGSSFENTSVQVDYTVGETVIQSGSSGSYTISQGFQQNNANTTAISEKQLNVDFVLYPNPAQDHVTLSLSAASSFGVQLSLSDIAGKVWFTDTKEEQVSGSYKRDIPLSGLAGGVYFINLYTDNVLYKSIRFVKQ